MKQKLWMATLIVGILGGVNLLGAERVLVRGSTPVHVRLKVDIDSTRAVMGDRVDLELAQPLTVNGLVVAPEGSVAWGAVQVVNKGKSVRFDVQGVRLPNLAIVKLRSIPEKTGNPAKDVIKVDQSLVPKGSEFVVYIDDDVSLEVAGPAPAVRRATAAAALTAPTEPAKPPIAARPAPTPLAPPVTTPPPEPPEEAQAAPPTGSTTASKPASTPVAATPEPVEPTPVTAVPVPSGQAAPATPGPTVTEPASRSTGMEGVTDWVTVECFSVPSGADILIDGDFYGNTPSILKLPVGKHRLRFILSGYAVFSQELELTAGSTLRTVRAELEKKEQ